MSRPSSARAARTAIVFAIASTAVSGYALWVVDANVVSFGPDVWARLDQVLAWLTRVAIVASAILATYLAMLGSMMALLSIMERIHRRPASMPPCAVRASAPGAKNVTRLSTSVTRLR